MEKENNIRIYEVVEDESEVFKISLVEEPAIEASMVYFAKQRPEFVTLESDERHMIFAPVLRPDFPIYRRDWDGEEYYIRFSKKSVERLAHDYLRNGYQWNWSTDHEKDVPELTLVESWIKMSENDKSVTLGLDPNLEIGTWFVGVYVNNVEVWERVKSGDFGGLSMEALLRLDELAFSKHKKITDKDNEKMTKDEMNNETFLERIKQIVVEALNLNKADEPAEEKVELEETPAEEQADEQEVELEETPIEETPEEPEDEEKEAMRAKIDELNAVIDELNAKVAELTGQVERLSKQPSTKEIKASAATQKQNPFEVIKQLRDGTYFSNGK